MARGRPAAVGGLIAALLAALGLGVQFDQTPLPPGLGTPLLLVGLLVFAVGVRANQLAPERPTYRDGEEEVLQYNPVQTPAIATMALGVLGFVATGYLLYFTRTPYVYPTVTGLVALALLVSGGATYYRNSLTTYYVTTERAIREYRMFSVDRSDVDIDAVGGVNRTDSRIERLVDAGTVTMRSPSTSVTFRSITDPETVRNEIDQLR
ncbi:PH domain-containing protein [Halorubellus litoreus]|uniref:PH domain-containing protein n=1 Tax=Halorubellus litoreus TaxID=755308 RepID=A0ABD5VBL3_9EURY